MSPILFEISENFQKQPTTGVLRKKCSENVQQFFRKECSENMQQVFKRTPMPNCDINKVALQLYCNHTSACVFSSKFAAYF